jgi:uncharacterized phage protein (TIGR02216 family)
VSVVDWTGLARLGLGRLRLTPEVFWALTPFELGLITDADAAPEPLGAPALAALMALYPDRVAAKETP